MSINMDGVIAGYCFCKGEHGFVRSASGTVTNFDAPGASGTLTSSINTGGAISGYYFDSSHVSRGFFHSVDGAITSFDAPGAGTGYSLGANALSINDDGVIAGHYSNPNDIYHGFQLTA